MQLGIINEYIETIQAFIFNIKERFWSLEGLESTKICILLFIFNTQAKEWVFSLFFGLFLLLSVKMFMRDESFTNKKNLKIFTQQRTR
jgi:hypothetical protein